MPFSSSSGSDATTAPIGLSGSDCYEIQSDSQGLAWPGRYQFGRLAETIWQTSGGASQFVHTQYGRTRFGAVAWRYDAKAHSLGTTVGTQQDNFYEYDGLYRPTLHQRGTLNAYHTGIDSPQQTEVFTLDQMGNCLAYQSDQLTPSQTRDFNPLNEITDLTNPTGVIQPAYDLAGNMTTIPAPADWTVAYTLTCDAWNRLTRVAEGSTLKGAYRYDALNRRLTTTLDDSTFRHYYYSGTQVLEERLGTTFARDYLWGLRGERELIRRRTGMSTPVYLYCLTDGPNPVAVTNTSGTVLERYSYDTYGAARFLEADFMARTPNESSDTVFWSFLWNGMFREDATGIYFTDNYFHSGLGIFVDPILRTTIHLSESRTALRYIGEPIADPYPFPFDPPYSTTDPYDVALAGKLCGVDATQWLIQSMKKNALHPTIQAIRRGPGPVSPRLQWLGWALERFASFVAPHKPWDFKRTESFGGGVCPRGCPHTVTLCGICFYYDVPGNIHFGFVGNAANFTRKVLKFAPGFVQEGGLKADDTPDTVAIDIGFDLYNAGADNLCTLVRANQDKLNKAKTEGCSPCSAVKPSPPL